MTATCGAEAGRAALRVKVGRRKMWSKCGLTIVAMVALVPVACTPAQYAKQADRTAYKTIARAQKFVLGGSGPFSVEYDPFTSRPKQGAGEIHVAGKVISLGEGRTQRLTLGDCLEIAFRNSRSFQDRTERLYGSALALANARRTWDWPFISGNIDSEWLDKRIGQDGRSSDVTADGRLSLTQRFVHGGVLTLAATLGFATDLFVGRDTTIRSLLEANFTQPLLRGAWSGSAYEQQYRLERNFLFAVFEYDRFTQTFASNTVTRYYSVLQRRDALENELKSIERLKETLALTRVLAEGGQISRIQEDQAHQDLLNAQVRLEQIDQAYRDALDEFKIVLGLPMVADVEPDYPGALEHLLEVGTKPIPVDEKLAVTVALSVRPDVLTERAELRDAARDVELAADDFLPQLDVSYGISAPGTPRREFGEVRFHEHTREAKLEFGYNLDQTDNRDAYRNSLIAAEKARRDWQEFVDRVRLEVRTSYRTLMQSERSYRLQLENVRIAKRRRKLASLQQKEGQASARDVLEAEDALRRAENGLTNALISYTTTRLQFLATLGMLSVDEKGRIHERAEPFRFKPIGRRYPYVATP